MEENCTSKWSEGLRFVQVRKNNALHHGLKCSPYEVLISEEDLDATMSNQQQHDHSFEILEHQDEEQTEI